MTLRICTIEKWLPAIGALWFFVIINSFIIWNPLAPIFHFVPALFVIWGSLLVNKWDDSKYNRRISVFAVVYFVWIVLTMCDGGAQIVKRSTDYIPLFFIFFWTKELQFKTYVLIRKVFIFYAIGCSILSILILLGFGNTIPHIVLPPREALHIRLGYVYYLYGVFVTICEPGLGVISRACGMLQEPGHFAILLGFIYLIDRLCGQKINYWIVIGGLFTFSSTFVLIVLFTEIHHLFSWKNLRKLIFSLPVIVLVFVLLYSFLPSDVKDQIEYFSYGRNLEQVVEAYNETSSLTGALDERANTFSITNYEKLSFSQYLFGGGYIDSGYALSDYRGMILHVGLLGVCLSILFYLSILIKTPSKMGIALGLTFFLIIIHRSWMLYEPYIFFFSFMAMTIHRGEEHNNECLYLNESLLNE